MLYFLQEQSCIFIYSDSRHLRNRLELFVTLRDHFITARCYAERGISMTSRLSVCNVGGLLEFFQNNFTVDYIRHLLTTQLAQTLACSLILSMLDYCNALLHGIPCGNIQKLQRVQNNAAWIVLQALRDLTPSHYYASCTGCRFNIKSRTSWRY